MSIPLFDLISLQTVTTLGLLLTLALGMVHAETSAADPYPPAEKRIKSAGNTSFFVDPVAGNDSNTGLTREKPWQSFRPVNARLLGPGDRVEILAPGSFRETLMPMGAGTAEKPVEIRFATGAYDFYPDAAIKLKLHISNSNDDPYTPKAIALLFKDIKHLKVTGDKADIYVHGKMIQTMFDHAEDVLLTGLAFDYRRPLVSEFTVLAVSTNYADVSIHPDSKYALENGRLIWIGEGWRSAGTALNQECDPSDDGRVWRRGSGPLTGVTRIEELSPFKLRMFFTTNPGFTAGRVIQCRETFRDCAAGLVQRSRNIILRNCAWYAMGGMGIVSQFSEDLTFDDIAFSPRPGSGRTTSSWADMLHFSGCRGKILVTDCEMSGSHDDPINVHGTHLRVVGKPAANKLLVRFMHAQTYGIEAFVPGDEIEFVSHVSLRAYATNRITAVEARNDKDILLTLSTPAPETIADKDVIENVTWTPSIEVRNCRISVDSCRGFLLSTRQPILIESNVFLKTTMSAILIADDANSWFESGPVRDVTIRGNQFIKCAEPVINIEPENHTTNDAEPVHENIRIIDNVFDLVGTVAIAAKSVRGLTITGNRFSTRVFPVQTNACTRVEVSNNLLNADMPLPRL
ncbi:MAG: right-handed parallel beta-helix repeat-containing protein [bacterium]